MPPKTTPAGPDALNGMVMCLTYSGALVTATLNMQEAAYVMQGAVLGKMAAEPILRILDEIVRVEVAQCELALGLATEAQPYGAWQNCNELLVAKATWGLASVNYAFIGAAMGFATKRPLVIGALSAAMTGASMFVNNLTNLVTWVVPSMEARVAPYQLFILYGTVALGFRCMYTLCPAPPPPQPAAAAGEAGEGGSDAEKGEGAASAKQKEDEASPEPEGGGKAGGEGEAAKKGKSIPLVDVFLVAQVALIKVQAPCRMVLWLNRPVQARRLGLCGARS